MCDYTHLTVGTVNTFTDFVLAGDCIHAQASITSCTSLEAPVSKAK